jgi:hypothetical protein
MFDVTYEEYGWFKNFANIDKLIFFLAVGFIKISIGMFNRRLTSMTSRMWLIFNNCFIALLGAYLMVALFWNIFQCDPPWAGWDAIRVGKSLGHKAKCTPDTIIGSALNCHTRAHGLWFALCATDCPVESQDGMEHEIETVFGLQYRGHERNRISCTPNWARQIGV